MSYIGIKLGMKKEIKPIFEKMQKWNSHLDQSDENLKVRWFYSYYSIYLLKQINNLNCDIADPEIEKIHAGLYTLDEKIPELRKADLKMMLSIFYHKANENRLALKTVHDLLNELSSKQNTQLYFTARFYYLILLIELDKIDYFEVAWLSTKRLLKNSTYATKESELLSAFFDGYHKQNKENQIAILEDLENELAQDNPIFNFKEWAKSKRISTEESIKL